MAFPRIITDRQVQYPGRYKMTLVQGTTDTYDLVAVPGNITEAGTPVNTAYLQPIEDQLGLIVGVNNQTIFQIKSFIESIDTRSLIPTTWNSDNFPTHIDVKDGITTVATLDITYDADNHITELIEVADGKTITYTQTWVNEQLTERKKVVV